MMLVRLHLVAAVVFVAAVVAQVFLAGLAIANLGGSGDFGTHIEFGYTGIGLAALFLVVTALVARRPRGDIGISLGLLGLYIVQTLLPSFKASVPWVAALPPVNALLLFGVAAWYARRTWQVSMA